LEAYEVADPIASGDLADLRDELGDLLLQVVFHENGYQFSTLLRSNRW
jgi:NTP pyrophosphatase (non-canonical NTP hydrolase)